MDEKLAENHNKNQNRNQKLKDYKCTCGFQFSKPGEFRNCEAFITEDGDSAVVCPECGSIWISKEQQ
jgi:DNA-directed RNA polymerase subunit RPC12/RpoP